MTPVMVVPAASPVNSVQELIALAKSKPGEMNYGSFGNGSYAHVAMEDFKQRTGTQMMHIPYRGAAPAYTALIRNETTVMIANLSGATAQAEAGNVRIIAAAGPHRSKARPDLPTVAESGVPGFSTSAWWGMFGPANLPRPLVDKIRADLSRILATPEMQKIYETNTMEREEMTTGTIRAIHSARHRKLGPTDQSRWHQARLSVSKSFVRGNHGTQSQRPHGPRSPAPRAALANPSPGDGQQEGCNLILTATDNAKLSQLAADLKQQHGVQVQTHAFDLSKHDNVKALADVAGDCDILVNNAGAMPRGSLHEVTPEAWRHGWDLKVFGYIDLTRYILPRMSARKSGVIINIIGMAAASGPSRSTSRPVAATPL